MKTVVSSLSLFLIASAAWAADDLTVAREALRDGLWQVARTHADKVPGDEAKLVVLESYAREGDWASVSNRLSGWTTASGVGFDYYRAAVTGDVVRAIGLLKDSGLAENLAESKMLEADLLARTGDVAGARKLWSEVIAMTNALERAFTTAAVNLGDVDLLRTAYGRATRLAWKRLTGLRLGVALVREQKTFAEGERIIRTIVKDSPDAVGAQEAYLSLAEAILAASDFQKAADAYRETIEIWPDAAKSAKVQEGLGWSLSRLGRHEEALDAFVRTESLADDDSSRAMALLKQGDELAQLGRGEESMSRYRLVLQKYPDAPVAEQTRRVIRIREQEARGLELYREFRFAEAAQLFDQVGKEEPSRKPKMDYFEILCLYGQGLDDEACAKAKKISETGPDMAIRADAMLWLAKFLFNRSEWKESGRLFSAYAEAVPEGKQAPEALVWSARASFASGDYGQAIQIVTKLVERYADSAFRSQALIVQGESLIELARFDEAVLVLEAAAMGKDVPSSDRVRARILKADALFAMGADNPVRYQSALEAYRAVRFGGALSTSGQLSVSFKIGRTLEKLKRIDEAVDQYYTQVVLAYREARERGERIDDDGRAVFSRAAFRLAEEYENRGNDFQAQKVLELVVGSDVPASKEAARRIDRILKKGSFL